MKLLITGFDDREESTMIRTELQATVNEDGMARLTDPPRCPDGALEAAALELIAVYKKGDTRGQAGWAREWGCRIIWHLLDERTALETERQAHERTLAELQAARQSTG